MTIGKILTIAVSFIALGHMGVTIVFSLLFFVVCNDTKLAAKFERTSVVCINPSLTLDQKQFKNHNETLKHFRCRCSRTVNCF